MSPLYAIMHHWASQPFVWGWSDCALGLADWIEAVRGVDPAAHLRGTYSCAQSCQRHTGWFTDPVAVIDGCLATIGGLPRIPDPVAGDIAVLVLPQDQGRGFPVGGLWLGDCWGVRCEGGSIDNRKSMTVGRHTPALATWGVGYEG